MPSSGVKTGESSPHSTSTVMYGLVNRFCTTRSTPSRSVAIVPIAAIDDVGRSAGKRSSNTASGASTFVAPPTAVAVWPIRSATFARGSKMRSFSSSGKNGHSRAKSKATAALLSRLHGAGAEAGGVAEGGVEIAVERAVRLQTIVLLLVALGDLLDRLDAVPACRIRKRV